MENASLREIESERQSNPPQMSHAHLIAWLRRQIASRAPAAAIRFGDGELRLLRAAGGNTCALEAARRQLQQQTGCGFQDEEIRKIGAAVERAHQEADILGILGRDRQTGERGIWSDHLVTLYRQRVSAGRPPTALAGCMLNHDLLAELPKLAVGRISVVSCRNLRPIIETRWGVEDVAVFQIPSQYKVRQVDGAYEATMHSLPIWPGVYERISSELTVREQGEVFLVGAGVFAKQLCVQIRESGGIALDMGSALDHMAGKITRGPMMRVLKLHAEGVPASEIAAKLDEQMNVHVERGRLERFIDTASQYIQ